MWISWCVFVVMIFEVSSSVTDLLSDSIELSLNSCRSQFKWDRWNCPTIQFLSKRVSGASLDRETAFVHAIGTAAIIYTYARNCSRGQDVGCECDIFGSDQCRAEKQLSLEYLGSSDFRLDPKGYGNAHNRRAGWIAVQNAMRKHCRCHGVSGSCAMRTCWSSMRSFAEIATGVKQMYSGANRLFVDNSGHLNSKEIRLDRLAFINDSPDYCRREAVPGWPGMANRQCSVSGPGSDASSQSPRRKACRNLCRQCGLKVRKQTRTEKRKCNCRFNWCCQVVCDSCVELIDEYRCSS
ncbi:protein Wnt-8c isoform X2 [Uranotaenia lowii]|uniref:protein Wnt-8c isoform X2 n=1 Tax=Uranotaenia lowii TaxID=190385 RepID=UPI002479CC70|nr:protein Wnt-8c isoform X2 [Uranotaenia lowii]